MKQSESLVMFACVVGSLVGLVGCPMIDKTEQRNTQSLQLKNNFTSVLAPVAPDCKPLVIEPFLQVRDPRKWSNQSFEPIQMIANLNECERIAFNLALLYDKKTDRSSPSDSVPRVDFEFCPPLNCVVRLRGIGSKHAKVARAEESIVALDASCKKYLATSWLFSRGANIASQTSSVYYDIPVQLDENLTANWTVQAASGAHKTLQDLYKSDECFDRCTKLNSPTRECIVWRAFKAADNSRLHCACLLRYLKIDAMSINAQQLDLASAQNALRILAINASSDASDSRICASSKDAVLAHQAAVSYLRVDFEALSECDLAELRPQVAASDELDLDIDECATKCSFADSCLLFKFDLDLQAGDWSWRRRCFLFFDSRAALQVSNWTLDQSPLDAASSHFGIFRKKLITRDNALPSAFYWTSAAFFALVAFAGLLLAKEVLRKEDKKLQDTQTDCNPATAKSDNIELSETNSEDCN